MKENEECAMCDLLHTTCNDCRNTQSYCLSFQVYSVKFQARCPNDGEMIFYRWWLKTPKMIMVEDLKAAVAEITEGHQEQIADELHARFEGDQRIRGIHQGVVLTSLRLMG